MHLETCEIHKYSAAALKSPLVPSKVSILGEHVVKIVCKRNIERIVMIIQLRLKGRKLCQYGHECWPKFERSNLVVGC